ncbi:Retrovirus-related Pol polyprotein from transposon TNT 1-94 [Cucumis melo var. makuwa]|uniref:Retrovirus-related Pol polyprotein from transposon TNT 1-94 n=1 Tax=Cucumis melo var. makuwa TaxID=1194695 RepID=A0A5A7UZX2_CUCMM|nr:Retrovirus-related Pol polyprotein from transposon TNT 1-94 [Cucumis melo var. makuwa]TYJ99770.1 Retrovirus-related Pol polyprotein from transposon TNT 1-94 [Cucumis melo var. makuwa]
MTPLKRWFTTYKVWDEGLLYMGNDKAYKIVGIGSVTLKFKDGTTTLLRNVRHVPSLKINLISLGMLDSIGCEYKGSVRRFEIFKDSKIVLGGTKINGLFHIKEVSMNHVVLIVSNDKLTEGDLWHIRLSRISGKGLKILSEQGIIPKGVAEKLSFCEHCVVGKSTRQSFQKADHNTKDILDYIHSNLWGPSQTPSLNNSMYFLTFTDDCSRKSWVYFLKSKDQTLGKFKE